MLGLAMVLPALSAYGEFGSRPGMESYTDYVIQIGGENLGSKVIEIVADSLRLRLPAWKKIPAAQVEVVVLGERIGEHSLLSLTAWIPEAADLKTDRQRHEVWDLARRQLEGELQRLAARTAEQQRKAVEKRFRELSGQQADLERRSAVLSEQVAMLEAESAGADRDSLAKAIAEAVSSQRGLQIEAAGIGARREAIEKRIDELRELAAAKGDSIVSELQKVVEVREAANEALKQHAAAGQRTQMEVMEGEAKLAEAKIELLRAQRDAEDRIGGGALRELNNELSQLLVEAAKVGGQQKQLEQIIGELREQVVATAKASMKLALLERELEAADSQRQPLEHQLASLKEQLTKLSAPQISLQPLVEDQAAAADADEWASPRESQVE
jgi:predicted  nucleic acid-binding Zn-ribbon protein